ncbi:MULTISPECIES: hypothetical protein [unclassified Methylobacterium]|uniref:hypothetical protein n=1 Tax=unclassified Methylobacterium TaxID=2615210 RepID=UPI00226A3FCA|nr:MULTISPECIES: hypothetical protein [unclassified Methylobacterium]
MPDPNLICEVRAAGKAYTNWLTVGITYTYADTNPIRHFTMTCAEPSAAGVMKLVPGDRVDVTLAGFTVIQDGFIKIRQAGFDANRHAVSIQGLAKAGHIQQASADLGQLTGYPFSAIANKIAAKYGVRFIMKNAPPGADLPFPRVAPNPGETDWQFLIGLARARGIRLTCAANGDLIGGVPDGGDGAVLVEGRNIISCSAYIEFPWAEQVIGRAQTPGSDGMFGKPAAEVAAKTSLNPGATGLTATIVADRPLSPEENKIATDAYASEILLATLRVTVVHHGWLKPGTNGLWELADRVTVYSPMAFGRVDKQDLRVFTVTCSQSPEGQSLTTVELVSEVAFQQRYADGQAQNPFDQGASKAGIIGSA